MPGMQELIKAIMALTAVLAAMLPAYQDSPGEADDVLATPPVAVAPEPAPPISPTQPAQPCPTMPSPAVPPTPPDEVEDDADPDNDHGETEAGEEGGEGANGGIENDSYDGTAETAPPISCPSPTATPAAPTGVPPPPGGTDLPPSAPIPSEDTPEPGVTEPQTPDIAPVAPAPIEPTAPGAPTPTAPGPVAPAAPGGPAVPVGNTELFVGDYETGDFSQWGTCQSVDVNSDCGPNYPSMEIVTDDVRQGKYAAHFIVNPGDEPDFGGERSEVKSSDPGAVTHEGDERWYEFSLKVGADFAPPEGWGLLLMQWHHGGDTGSPPLSLVVRSDGNLFLDNQVDIGNTQEIGPLPKGEWKDYVLHIKFSKDSSIGFVEAWENGQQVVPMTNRATMSTDENTLKQGVYRDSQSVTHEAWWDGLRVTGP